MIFAPKISAELVEALRVVLDRPIAFHRVFVKLSGSVTAALLLSQAVYWSKRTNTNDEGWFYKTREQWEEETGLTRYEQETARKVLRRFTFWKEDLRGVPAQMHYRVDITALSAELLLLPRSRSSARKPHEIARLLETSQLDGGETAGKMAGNQQACLLETSQPYKGISEITTEITTTPLTPLGSSPDEQGGGRDFVEKLIAGTLLQGADPGRVLKAAKKYKRSQEQLTNVIDVLDQQYRQGIRKIDDPTALIVSALKDGVDPPEGYVPKAAREAAAAQRRETARTQREKEQREKESQDNAYRQAEAILFALPEEKREELFSRARTALPAILRNSRLAVRTAAINLLIENAGVPHRTES